MPPAQGALLGAFVTPKTFTQPGRVQAFSDFEQLIGRPLDLVHVFHEWNNDFPTSGDVDLASSKKLLMISWAGEDTRVIASGRDDDLIRQRARAIAQLPVPVLLRWRWEMDRPNLRAEVWGPTDYIAAWRHIRQIFDEEKVANVGWVWCPHAEGFVDKSRAAEQYYPGDDQVDWMCADVYAEPSGASFADAAGPFLDFATQHPGKPIVIGEFGVQKGDRAAWLRGAFDVIESHPQIKAISYFEGKSEGRRNYDHLLERTPEALAAFRERAGDPAFRQSR